MCLPRGQVIYHDFQDCLMVFLIQVLDISVKFTPKYFIFFVCFCNLRLICHLFAIVLLFIQRFLCIDFITQHLVKFSCYYSGFSIRYFEFSRCTIISFINRYGFSSSFQILMLLFIFSCLLSLFHLYYKAKK